MTLTVHVTQQHIDAGNPRCIYECPVALALREAGYPDAFAGPFRIYINRAIETPASAFYFMEAFDNDQPVEPFSFEIPNET